MATDLTRMPIGTRLRITSDDGEHGFPVGTVVRITPNDEAPGFLDPGEYLATINDPHAENYWAHGVTAFVTLLGTDANAEVDGDPDADLIERMAEAAWGVSANRPFGTATEESRAHYREQARAVLAVVREDGAR